MVVGGSITEGETDVSDSIHCFNFFPFFLRNQSEKLTILIFWGFNFLGKINGEEKFST